MTQRVGRLAGKDDQHAFYIGYKYSQYLQNRPIFYSLTDNNTKIGPDWTLLELDILLFVALHSAALTSITADITVCCIIFAPLGHKLHFGVNLMSWARKCFGEVSRNKKI